MARDAPPGRVCDNSGMPLTTEHASMPHKGAIRFRLARPARIAGGLLCFCVLAVGCAPVEKNGGGVLDGAAGTSGGTCTGSGGCAGRSATRDASEDVPVGGTGQGGSTGIAGATGTAGSTDRAGATGTAGAPGTAGATGEGGGSSAGTSGTSCGSGGGCGGSASTPDAGAAPGDAALVCIGPAVSEDPTLRRPGPRPDAGAATCGAWASTNGVCCAQYCSNDDKSEDCSKCGGPGAA